MIEKWNGQLPPVQSGQGAGGLILQMPRPQWKPAGSTLQYKSAFRRVSFRLSDLPGA
jgi:hypothetical protein